MTIAMEIDAGLSGLEQAIAEAAQDERRKDEVGRYLLDGELYVLGEKSPDPVSGRMDVRIVFHTFEGVTYLSAFTSMWRLRNVAGGDQPYLLLRGGLVFRSVQPGTQLVINLGSWPCLAFDHEAASRLGREWHDAAPPVVRSPQSYPAGLLEALWDRFQGQPEVQEAHVAEVMEEGHPVQLVIGLRLRRPELIEQAREEVRAVASQVHDAEVRVEHLGEDLLSRQVLQDGLRFFTRADALGPGDLVPC
ncbi:MAG TPA: enhanced serine sensitivity protein SseB C-terminal domain-containing protein [Candidatus Dormibacteraeota bacterium]|nr:enhanced serine sensitivity protein SseB C-terminal domain-containing protein [Candidatus Dormibacteraeota bacterium]